MYKPGATNCADAPTRQEQDLDNQIAKKIALWTQTLLGPERLDPWIQAELDKDLLNAELCSINKSGLDFIDELLQANCTATSLQEYCEEAKDGKGKWTLENGLLTPGTASGSQGPELMDLLDCRSSLSSLYSPPGQEQDPQDHWQPLLLARNDD